MKKNISHKKKKQLQTEDLVFPNWHFLRKYAPFIILAITIAALIVRAYRVGFLTVWLDEYMHINPAIDIINGRDVNQSDTNGMFLTWVVALFFKIFGVSEFTARIPSVLFGSASVYLIYVLSSKLYNKSVGMISALLSAFSLYLIVWARIARNYASFEFSFLLLILVIWILFNSVHRKFQKPGWYLTRNNINIVYLLILPAVFIFSLLNHQLTFFILFCLAFYILIIAIIKVIRKHPNPFTNIYSILAYFVIVGIVIFFVPPLLESVARPILGILLPDRIINWVLPDWEFIIEEFKNPEKRLKSFMVYFNIIRNDFSWIFYLGGFGIISSFFIKGRRKEAVFLFSLFVIPLLLMSFIFREPATPNYLYYIYPIFIIYISIFIYFVFNNLFPLFVSKDKQRSKSFNIFCLILVLVVITIGIPAKEIKALINREEHGQIVKKEFFHTTLVNWKEVCNQVKPYVRKQDVVFSTWVSATNFYLDRDNSIWFRQRHYDTQQRMYVNYESNGEKLSAYTYEDVVRVYNENPTGWLFADYYFDKVMTDPRAKDFAIRNMDYHFNIGNDGEVRVFSWDHNRPRKFRNSMLIDLGKDVKKQASKELDFTIQSLDAISGNLLLYIDAEGIDKPKEAYVVINKKNVAVFQPYNQKGGNVRRGDFVAVINKAWLQQGTNIMQFAYNDQLRDYPRGFVIYNIKFQNQ